MAITAALIGFGLFWLTVYFGLRWRNLWVDLRILGRFDQSSLAEFQR